LISANRCGGAADHFGERAEARDQVFGQRLDIALGNGAEQDQFEELVVAERVGARLEETRPQALAMAVVVRASSASPAGFLGVSSAGIRGRH
jgi:hypothetical protein